MLHFVKKFEQQYAIMLKRGDPISFHQYCLALHALFPQAEKALRNIPFSSFTSDDTQGSHFICVFPLSGVVAPVMTASHWGSVLERCCSLEVHHPV